MLTRPANLLKPIPGINYPLQSALKQSDAEIEAAFCAIGYDLSVADLYFTDETIDDYRRAQRGWESPGHVLFDIKDTLVIADAKPRQEMPSRHIAVIDFGRARAVMGGNLD